MDFYKRNEKNEIARYKARFMTQGFSQRLGINYKEIYSFMMHAIKFHYLMIVYEKLNIHIMDVIIAHVWIKTIWTNML